MAELTPGAARLLTRHLKQVRRAIGRSGADADAVELAVSAIEEQVHALFEGQGAPVEGPAMKEVLSGLEPPDGWAREAGRDPDRGLAVLALIATFVTLAVLTLAGVFSHVIGGDGGQISATIGLFGFVPAFVLGVIARAHPAGRAALIVSGLFVAVFLIAWAVAAALG